MRIRDFTTVILRLYALYLFFSCIPAIYRFPMHWQYGLTQNDTVRKYLLIDDAITIGLYIIVGILLLLFAQRLATWITGDVKEEVSVQIDPSHLLRAGLAIAGAVFVLHGIQRLAYASSHWYFLPETGFGPFGRSRLESTLEQKAKVVESVVTVVAGLVLFIGKKRLTDFAIAIRTYGRVSPEVDNNRPTDEKD